MTKAKGPALIPLLILMKGDRDDMPVTLVSITQAGFVILVVIPVLISLLLAAR
jgi:hypothetical protein